MDSKVDKFPPTACNVGSDKTPAEPEIGIGGLKEEKSRLWMQERRIKATVSHWHYVTGGALTQESSCHKRSICLRAKQLL